MLYIILSSHILLQYCTLFYCLHHAVTLVNEKFDGIWTSCGLRRRFRCGYGGFGFYDHSDINAAAPASPYKHLLKPLRDVLLNISHSFCTCNGDHVGLLMKTGNVQKERTMTLTIICNFFKSSGGR